MFAQARQEENRLRVATKQEVIELRLDPGQASFAQGSNQTAPYSFVGGVSCGYRGLPAWSESGPGGQKPQTVTGISSL